MTTLIKNSFDPLLSLIRTKDDRSLLLSLIQNLEARLFQISGDDLQKLINESIPENIAVELRSAVAAIPPNDENYKNYFLPLEKCLTELIILRIDVAVPLTENLI